MHVEHGTFGNCAIVVYEDSWGYLMWILLMYMLQSDYYFLLRTICIFFLTQSCSCDIQLSPNITPCHLACALLPSLELNHWLDMHIVTSN